MNSTNFTQPRNLIAGVTYDGYDFVCIVNSKTLNNLVKLLRKIFI